MTIPLAALETQYGRGHVVTLIALHYGESMWQGLGSHFLLLFIWETCI